MKRCPTCNQTFEEDWLSFCTQDGTTLIEDPVVSSQPPPTILAASPPSPTGPNTPATWNLPSGNIGESGAPSRQPQPIQPAWQPPPPPAYFQPNKSLATASMVIGIISATVGWLCLGPIPGVLAIILGAVALSQIKKNPERNAGGQLAWIGIATGTLTVVVYVIFFLIYIIALIASVKT